MGLVAGLYINDREHVYLAMGVSFILAAQFELLFALLDGVRSKLSFREWFFRRPAPGFIPIIFTMI